MTTAVYSHYHNSCKNYYFSKCIYLCWEKSLACFTFMSCRWQENDKNRSGAAYGPVNPDNGNNLADWRVLNLKSSFPLLIMVLTIFRLFGLLLSQLGGGGALLSSFASCTEYLFWKYIFFMTLVNRNVIWQKITEKKQWHFSILCSKLVQGAGNLVTFTKLINFWGIFLSFQ